MSLHRRVLVSRGVSFSLALESAGNVYTVIECDNVQM